MTTAEVKWNLIKIGSIVLGILVATFLVGTAILTALGFVGTLGALLILSLMLGAVGLIVAVGLLWLVYSFVRVGDVLDRLEPHLRE